MQRKTVLITGASRGIGKAIALQFAKAGNYQLVITCASSHEQLEETKQEIQATGTPCLSFVGHIGNFEQVEILFQQIQENFGSVDILINNAGVSYIGLLTDMQLQEWNYTIETNLHALFHCCKFAVPAMVRKQEGKIINISSVWGCVGASCEVAYSTTKGGMNAFTKALAKELAPSHIQVNAIACGAIDTEMNHSLSPEEKQDLIDEIPAGRLGKPEEVANLVFDICKGHNYLTGQIIQLDGGWI